MKTNWKVSHFLSKSIDYASGPTEYLGLGVKLIEKNSTIDQVDHTFSDENSCSKEDLIRVSNETLDVFWELIRFRGGYWIEVRNHKIEQLAHSAETSASITSLQSNFGTSNIVKAVSFPNETALTTDPRLKVWLRLAVQARPPSLASDAIRNYYMILEDMYGSSMPGGQMEELKFIRHFVSHGFPMTVTKLTKYLEGQFGKPVTHYDPFDSAHIGFLDDKREWARKLAESEIEKRL